MDSDIDAEVQAQLLAFVEQTTDFIGVSDPWGRILYLNPAAKKRLGVADVTGLTLADLFPLEAFAFYYEEVRPQLLRSGAWTGEFLLKSADGGAVPMYISTTAKVGPGGETNGGVVFAHELARLDPGVAAESDVDDVTGVLTRAAFDERVRLALSAAHRDGEACALVLAEIVGMSSLIDSMGTFSAATVVRVLASRLTRLARTIDIVGRVGENQLGLVLRGVRSYGEALRIARSVYDSMVDPPVTTAGGEVVVSVGCGVALSKPGDSPDDLVRQASETMSHSPAAREVDVVAPTVIADRPEVSVTMDEFRVAMSHGRVRAYAQPVVDLDSSAVIGFQARARWHHRTSGVLSASTFVGMIADTPLANEVDLYVARETAAVLAVTPGDAPLRLYTPVSNRLLADVRAEQYLAEIADAYFLSMTQMHLQLARPRFDDGSRLLQDALQSMVDAGVTLALTGVEGVSDGRLGAKGEFHELHLSRRLSRAAANEPAAWRVVSEIVRGAHDRGLVVAATGVDQPTQRDALIEAGCDLAIGDLFGRAEPTDTIA